MTFNSDDSDSESVKLPVASSPEDDFSTPLRRDITLTPSTLNFNMTESEKKKSSIRSKLGDMTKSFAYGATEPKEPTAATKSQVNFETPFSAEREAEIAEERKKAAAEFPNPVEDSLPSGRSGGPIFTIEENEQWYDVPPNIDPDQNREQSYKDLIRANVLKGQRRAFYSTITKMKNRIMKSTYDASPQEWTVLQGKCRETLASLSNITQELGTYGFQNSPQEIRSYTRYFSDLRTLLNKIENIVEAEHDEELREAFLTTYLKEEDAFSKGISVEDLADDFNQTLGAGANSTQFKWKADPQPAADDDDNNVDDILFKDGRTKQPTDSDDDEETFRENTGASKSFYSEPQTPGNLYAECQTIHHQTKETKGGQEANRPCRQGEDNHLITTGGPHLQTCDNNKDSSGQDSLNSTPTTLHNPPPTTRVLKRFKLRSLTEARKPTRDSNSSSRPLTSKIETFPIPIWH
jgi:hypothetical protein